MIGPSLPVGARYRHHYIAGEPTGEGVARVLEKAKATVAARPGLRVVVITSTDAAKFKTVRGLGGHMLLSTPRGFLTWGGAVEWHLHKSDDASSRDEAAAAIRLRWRVDSEGNVHGPTARVDIQGMPPWAPPRQWTSTSLGAYRCTLDKLYIKPGGRYNYLRARLAGNSYE